MGPSQPVSLFLVSHPVINSTKIFICAGPNGGFILLAASSLFLALNEPLAETSRRPSTTFQFPEAFSLVAAVLQVLGKKKYI